MIKNNLPYLRHSNGRGKIYDTSEACECSYISRDSVVRGLSSVWNSRVTDSVIQNSTVTDSEITGSEIIETLVTGGAVISDSLVHCEIVTGQARIEGSEITGKSRVAHFARIENSRFKNLTVKGSAVLAWNNENVFDGCFGYISRGVWHRPPRVFLISNRITITESVAGFVFVHCREYPIEKLLQIGNRLGRSQQWTAEEILAVRKICHYLSKNPC